MSGIEQQKNINYGAKLTGKIAGGIYFTGNTTEVTDVGAGNTWVNIGAGAVGAGLFQLMPIQPVSAPVSSGVTAINDYFELLSPTGATTSAQQLWYRYGKRAVHYCSFTLVLYDATAMGAANVSFQARVNSVDSLGTETVITQSIVSFTAFGQDPSPVSHTFPLVVPADQRFFLQINNIESTRDITVRDASLAIYE